GPPSRTAPGSPPAEARCDFMLSRLLVCGVCGGWMSGWRPPYASHVVVYRCSRAVAAGADRCRLNTVNEAEVLACVLETLKGYFLNPDFIRRLRAKAAELDGADASEGRRDAQRAELAQIDKKLARAMK